jgi:hypothetical protein
MKRGFKILIELRQRERSEDYIKYICMSQHKFSLLSVIVKIGYFQLFGTEYIGKYIAAL